MIGDSSNQFIRTTVYINRRLHEEAKIMAVLTRTSVSHILCTALKDKIKQIRNQEVKEIK
jgi:hypothetical protein